VVIAARRGGLGCYYKETAVLRGMLRGEAARNIQHIAPKTILKYYSEFYVFHITSLIHTRNWVTYASTPIHTNEVCTAPGCRVVRHSSFSIGRAPFIPHLPGGILFLQAREYQLPGAMVSEVRRTAMGGIFRGAVV